MADPAPRPSNELRTRIGIGLALIAVAIGALLAGGAIFWILVSVAGLLMQAEWADLAEAPAQNKRSEEHTSEPPVTNAHLVCRLLLEKKNKHEYITLNTHTHYMKTH